MNASSSFSETGNGGFNTTIWTDIRRAQDAADADTHQALNDLCHRYWYPIYAYVRRRGYSFHDAQDLTQGFFTRLLEKDYLSTADSLKGRFRSFLINSLKWFLSKEWVRAKAGKRGGEAEQFSLDEDVAEERFQADPGVDEELEKSFDREFAHLVFERSLDRLRREMDEERFQHLSGHLLGDGGRSYVETATILGLSETGVKAAVRRMRQRCGECFREEISETVVTSNEIDDEVRYLLTLLG